MPCSLVKVGEMLRNLLGPCTLKEGPKPPQTLLSHPRTMPRGVRASPVHATSIHTACGDTDTSPSFLGAVPPAPSLLPLGRSPHSTRADHSQAPRFRVNTLTLGLQRGSLASGGIQGATSSPALTLGIPQPPGLGSDSAHGACVQPQPQAGRDG